MIKRKPTNECIIEVTPRSAGNYGFVRISGEERSAQAEYNLCKEIESNIKRHVDDVEYTNVTQKYNYETNDGSEFDTLYQALEYEFASDEYTTPRYECRHERPNDNGVGHVCYRDNFKDVIEEAYSNPWNFTVKGYILTEDEEEFLKTVIEAGLKSKNT